MELVCIKRKGVGEISLNRPHALNALTLPMLEEIRKYLDVWEEDKEVFCVLLRSAHERAFCSGADIKMFYDNHILGAEKSAAFCAFEYDLNYRIHTYSKPIVALVDGLVMGGGVGLCLYASHFIVTARTRFAMPEVRIGFFPDVGCSYPFLKLPFHVGYYLAVTGSSILGEDVHALGLAHHLIDFKDQEVLLESLPHKLNETLEVLSKPKKPISLPLKKIEEAFSHDKLHDVISSYGEEPFQGASPIAVMLAFKWLKRGCHLTFRDALLRDKQLAKALFQREDVYEALERKIGKKEVPALWKIPMKWPFKELENQVDSFLNTLL